MPVRVVKRGELFRLIEADGSLAKTENGKPRDGGGHRTKKKAAVQARVINASIAKA